MKKIYFNRNLTDTYSWVPFLSPILGICKNDYQIKFGIYDLTQIKNWKNLGKKYIKFSRIEDCDFVLFPMDYRIDFFNLLKKEAYVAKKYNKKIIAFNTSDIEIPVPYIDNLILFRTSIGKDSPEYENPLPTFPSSIWDSKKNKKKRKGISIGYVGYKGKISKSLLIWEKIRTLNIVKKFFNWRLYNTKLINLISDKWCKNPLIKKDSLGFFILQNGKGDIFRGKCITRLQKSKYEFNFKERGNVLNPKIKGKMRQEYINSVYDSTFTLIVRGFGNYTFRLYETMSAGRIPLFIDTNSKIPFEDLFNYNNLFLKVPYEDIDNIDIYR